MWFPLVPLYVFAAIASSIGFGLQASKPACPPKEEIQPCTCDALDTVAMKCNNINDVATLNKAFSRSLTWNVQYVHFQDCVLNYIPKAIAEMTTLRQIIISRSTLVSMFDSTPSRTSEMEVYLYDCKFHKIMQWDLFRNTSINSLGFFNVQFKYIDHHFRDSMPSGMKSLWFSFSKTARIAQRAFWRLENLFLMTLTGGTIKEISRDMFPKPCKLQFVDFSHQKIVSLPVDMFDEMPELRVISLKHNGLATLDEKLFAKSNIDAILVSDNPMYCDCKVRWITTFKNKKKEAKVLGECTGPSSFKGRDLRNLKTAEFDFCK